VASLQNIREVGGHDMFYRQHPLRCPCSRTKMSTFSSVYALCSGVAAYGGWMEARKPVLARRRWSMYHQPFVHGRYPHKPNANRRVEAFSSSAIEDDRIFLNVLPPRLPEITYTILLRPRRLRHLAHRILLRCVPSDVTIQGLKLYLKPQ
jgi:hypothetical protein